MVFDANLPKKRKSWYYLKKKKKILGTKFPIKEKHLKKQKKLHGKIKRYIYSSGYKIASWIIIIIYIYR